MVSFRETSVDDPDAHALIAEYFDMRAATFPTGDYSPVFPKAENFTPPTGVFLIVVENGEDVGCGGIKRLAPERYEIKHLWIRPLVQGRGLGRALLTELEKRARAFGATEVVLDTNASLLAAGSMYRSGGYEEIAPYNDNPNATNWFRKKLVG
ncbi:MAG TPA: GNAT family N-acetyltransferase [Galbitalea sp.]|nr:GNAT family N-acetyltransferase [Galbitalea sp.]